MRIGPFCAMGALIGALCVTTSSGFAQTETPPEEDPARWLKELDVEAGTVEADVKLRQLELKDHVKIRLAPYTLRSDHVRLSMTRFGVQVKGAGELGFCPCDDPPIAIGFSGGYAAPPDDLIVEDPTLKLFGVPIFWLPWLWLRSPRKIGLTTPSVSFRGGDGLFLGQGVHVPVGKGLELGAGLYTRGGYAVTADLSTERSRTIVRWDFRSGNSVGARDDIPSGHGLAVDAHGEVGVAKPDAPYAAWDVDAIRGARGLRTTLDLEPLSRPFDRASAETRLGPMTIGLDFVDARAEALDHYAFARPYGSLAAATAIGEEGGTAMRVSFGPRFVRARRADAIGDALWSTDLAVPLGVAQLASSTTVEGRAARSGGSVTVDQGSARAAAIVAESRLELSLPLARALSLERAAGGPPVLHVIEPLLRASFVGARGGGDREALAGFSATPLLVDGASGDPLTPLETRNIGVSVAAVGVRNTIGAMSGGIAPGTDPWIGKISLEIVGGTLVTPSRRDAAGAGDLSVVARRSNGGGWDVTLRGAIARTLLRDADRTFGWIGLARVRIDTSRDGLRVEARGAARGSMPVIGGWALLGADAAPRVSTMTGLFTPGATVGLGVGFPLGLGLRLGGDVDAYGNEFASFGRKDEAHLLDVHSTLKYRHPCGCFRFALRGGHVVGREGVDVFATLELARVEPYETNDW